MELLKDTTKISLQLKQQLTHLHERQICKDRILSSLIEERNKLLQGTTQQATNCPPDGTLSHYHYILPLVKEIHLFELRLKEQQKEYDKLKLQCEAARLGHAVLVDSFDEVECVLKRWSRELKEFSCKAAGDNMAETTESVTCRVTNITYHAEIELQVLIEELGFTVLCQGVHVRVIIKSQITCPNIHLPSLPTSARIGVSSDTYVPRLAETVMAVISQGSHVSEIISLVSQHIQEDMAPYVIIIPIKKKVGKHKEIKSQGLKTSNTKTIKGTVCDQSSEISQ